MWIMMNDGFVSVVQADDNPRMLIVRARRKNILVMLNKELRRPAQITRNDDADYRWRIKIGKTAFKDMIAERIDRIDYGNFKGSVAKDNKPLQDFYANVWTCGWNYQVADDVPAA